MDAQAVERARKHFLQEMAVRKIMKDIKPLPHGARDGGEKVSMLNRVARSVVDGAHVVVDGKNAVAMANVNQQAHARGRAETSDDDFDEDVFPASPSTACLDLV